MKGLRIIGVVVMAVFTLFMLFLSLCCIDLALHGLWPASWMAWHRAMSMNHVTSRQYLQGLNATCVVIGSLMTVQLSFMTIDFYKKRR